MPIIEAKNLCKDYLMGQVKVTALNGIDLIIEEGEFVSICGPSGSGKTTLLNILGCLDTPTQGSLKILDQDPKNLTDTALSQLRNRSLGFIFQTFNLIPVLNAFENVEYPLWILGTNQKERKERVEQMLVQVGLSDYQKHRPDELSGGQRQRVAIARALVTHPKMVIADEPTANLDHTTGEAVLQIMHKMNAELACTFIFSTHDPEVVKHAKKIYRVRDGKLLLEGSV